MELQGEYKRMTLKFSIIVPVYNVEKYLAECIESIVRQTYTDWELLLIEDGSTDSSKGICSYYAEKNNKIRLFERENSGVSASRNYGVEKAKGDYIVFIDSDDYIAENTLEKFYFECCKWSLPDVVLSEGMYEIRGEKIAEYKHWDMENYRGISGRDALIKTMENAPNWSPCDKCYRLEFWRNYRFAFPIDTLAEDFALIDKVVLAAKRVSMVPSYYFYRRFRKNSTMSFKKNKKLKRDELQHLIEWESFLQERESDKELVTAFRRTFAKLYCHDILGYLFLFHGDEKKILLEKIEKLKIYLDYVEGKEEKAVSILVHLFGIRFTCMLLGVVKRYRIQREEKGVRNVYE